MNKVVGLDITTELSLGLPDARHTQSIERAEKKRVFLDMISEDMELKLDRKCRVTKNQAVGWPPVCSYRKRNVLDGRAGMETSKNYVKVSMDGTVYLRKVDLSMQKGYSDLALALDSLFACHGIVKALKDGDSSEYMLIYEDKDRDWMLVGDVPWEMFIASCKRLRIMKRFEGRNETESLQTRDFLKRDSSPEES